MDAAALRYQVSLGVDENNDRVCVAEVAPFATKEEAEAFCAAWVGRESRDLLAQGAPGFEVVPMDTDQGIVRGWTIESYTLDEGTQEAWISTT